MTQSIENKTKVWIGIVVVVLLANGWLSYRAVRTLIDNERWVTHTHQVLGNLELILSTVKDAETGERGYIITGDSEYLEPYHSAINLIDTHLQTLKDLTVDDPTEQDRLPTLARKVADRLHSLKEGVDLRAAGDVEGARQVTLSGVGKQRMDDLRQFIEGMENEENRLLTERLEESRISRRDTILTFTVANLVAMSLLVAMGSAIIKGFRERRETEDRLYEQRQLLAVTLSSIADAVISCNTDGSTEFLNPIAESLTGWKQHEAYGQPVSKIFNIIDEESRRPVDNPAMRAIREGAIVGLANHTVLLRKDGSEIPIDDNGAPIKTADGKTLGAVLIFRDMSERRRIENELTRLLAAERSARQHAETASRTKDEFLAILSHELKTPLTAVFGWVQLLRKRNMDTTTLEKALEVIDRNLRIQNQLIDDLLNTSQIITGKLNLRREMVNPLEIVNATIETVRPSADAKDITIQVEGDGRPPALFADPARLQQIVWNLLSNAVKFTPRGGIVTMRVHQYEGELQIQVRDSGEGISRDFLPQVFDRFSQADASKTRPHGGLGLGLALARQLVELHGGRIQAQSAGLGKGSTFTVSLPLPGSNVKLSGTDALPQG
jgi:PAS domain S-box-containing protein